MVIREEPTVAESAEPEARERLRRARLSDVQVRDVKRLQVSARSACAEELDRLARHGRVAPAGGDEAHDLARAVVRRDVAEDYDTVGCAPAAGGVNRIDGDQAADRDAQRRSDAELLDLHVETPFLVRTGPRPVVTLDCATSVS